MAALVQTYTQDPTTITMLQTRPTSATGRMPSGQQQPALSYAAVAQAPRSAYSGYRGSSTPIQQYAFTSTPSLNQLPPPQQSAPHRTSPTQEYHDPNVARGRFPTQTHVANNSNTGPGQLGSRDDSSIVQGRNGVSSSRSQSAHLGSGKVAPDRYRRGNVQAAPHTRSQSVTLPSTANLPNMAQFYGISNNSRTTLPARPASFYATVPGSSMDDMHIPQQPKVDAKGLRRRSMQGLDPANALQLPQFDHSLKLGDGDASTIQKLPGTSGHSRNGSSDSVNSSRSNHSRPSVSDLLPIPALSNHIIPMWSHG